MAARALYWVLRCAHTASGTARRCRRVCARGVHDGPAERGRRLAAARARLQEEVSHLAKLPRHVAIILDCEQEAREAGSTGAGASGALFVARVAEVLQWLEASRVETVTVFDAAGLPPRLEQLLAAVLCDNSAGRRPILVDVAPTDVAHGRHRDDDSAAGGDATANMRVRLVGGSGRSDMAAALRVLCEESQAASATGDPVAAAIDDAALSKRLSGSACRSEPELLLRFGELPTLDGFAPWNLRLSEIQQVGSLADYSIAQFCRTLWRHVVASRTALADLTRTPDLRPARRVILCCVRVGWPVTLLARVCLVPLSKGAREATR